MLDNLDTKILKALESDARQSKAAIAQQLHISKTVVSYRINRLEKKGIIKGYGYISNQAALGLLSFGLLIKFQGLFLEEQERIISQMRLSKKFNWVAATNGKWDMVGVAVGSGILAFNTLLEEFFARYGTYIKEYNFYIDYEGSISGHNHLYKEPYPESVIYRNPGSDVVLSDMELAVYKRLQRNPQLSLLSIAKRLDKTYETVQSKYRALIAKNILLKATPIISNEALGYDNILCLYNLAPNPERVNQLLSFCEKHPNIVRYSRTLGHVNLIFNIHSQGSRHLKEIVSTINKRFSDVIISCDFNQIVER